MKWFLYSLLFGMAIGIAGWIIAAPCYRFDHLSTCPRLDCDQVTNTLCLVYYCDDAVPCEISGAPPEAKYRMMVKPRYLGRIWRDGMFIECAGRLAGPISRTNSCCDCEGYRWEPMP